MVLFIYFRTDHHPRGVRTDHHLLGICNATRHLRSFFFVGLGALLCPFWTPDLVASLIYRRSFRIFVLFLPSSLNFFFVYSP
ncbi:hypothetical protein F5H01DRAFT_338397 [Linnemannia elongata]|nr:hypothetical protein F5H01DRAFT_338397 [Linnemannia elongata]